MKTLHLTLKKKWFDQILSGEKNIEYREIKPYWVKRLFNDDGMPKTFDVIHFKNGYNKNAPYMIVEWVYVRVRAKFEIILGEILEKGNI